jgi:hypothetical protein
MKRFSTTTLVALGMLLGTVPFARAADATCGNATISNTTIGGNLSVTGACFLGSDVTVGGNVWVGAGASLVIQATSLPVKIGGNIQTTTGCEYVEILAEPASVTIGGNVGIEGCTRFVSSGYSSDNGNLNIGGNFECTGNTTFCFAESGSVRGNVQVDSNSEGAEVTNNKVGGNVQVDGNAASDPGNTTVSGNKIGGNLTCTGNSGTVDTEGGNGGKTGGQCTP